MAWRNPQWINPILDISIDNEKIQIIDQRMSLHVLVECRRVIAVVPQLIDLAVSTYFSKQPYLLKLLGTSRAYCVVMGGGGGICLCFYLAYMVF